MSAVHASNSTNSAEIPVDKHKEIEQVEKATTSKQLTQRVINDKTEEEERSSSKSTSNLENSQAHISTELKPSVLATKPSESTIYNNTVKKALTNPNKTKIVTPSLAQSTEVPQKQVVELTIIKDKTKKDHNSKLNESAPTPLEPSSNLIESSQAKANQQVNKTITAPVTTKAESTITQRLNLVEPVAESTKASSIETNAVIRKRWSMSSLEVPEMIAMRDSVVEKTLEESITIESSALDIWANENSKINEPIEAAKRSLKSKVTTTKNNTIPTTKNNPKSKLANEQTTLGKESR